MGICAKEFRELVIRPTLTHLGESHARRNVAENLLLGTAAQESGLGFHLKFQRARGIGIYQITANTHTKIWDKHLINNPDLASAVRGLASQHEFLAHPHAELATNLSYATAIAWMNYSRAKKALPPADDILALGHYWAKHFSHRQDAKAEDFCASYKEFVGGVNDNNLAA